MVVNTLFVFWVLPEVELTRRVLVSKSLEMVSYSENKSDFLDAETAKGGTCLCQVRLSTMVTPIRLKDFLFSRAMSFITMEGAF